MKGTRRRKCRHCKDLFYPHSRSKGRQKHCSKLECQRARKAANQRRWLSHPENRDYFRGPANVERVRRWRADHHGYWRRKRRGSADALQDALLTQASESNEESSQLAEGALQDALLSQPPVLIGLIAQLTGSALQDDIAAAWHTLVGLGQDIVHSGGGRDGGRETSDLPREGAAGTTAV